jgi:3-oxoacyl-ACP reductase-like protein
MENLDASIWSYAGIVNVDLAECIATVWRLGDDWAAGIAIAVAVGASSGESDGARQGSGCG